jgi:UTP--glucose-1-phosphate uridylyltransferase
MPTRRGAARSRDRMPWNTDQLILFIVMHVKKAIFPGGGLGTRFLPATKAQPKEMLPVVDKPLIQYAVEEAYAAGVREMIFVTGRHKRPIEDHFDMTFELEVALEQAGKASELLDVVRSVKPDDMECIYVRQAQALGLGHAVLCGQRLVGNEPFAVLLADDLMVGETPILAQMVEQFRSGAPRSWRCRKCRPSTRAATASWRAAVNERVMDVNRIVEKPSPEAAPSRAGRGRPLHPDAGRVPRNCEPAARRGRRDPADRRHRLRCCAARRCLPTATKASATTAAARKASWRPTSNWRWPTRRWARASAAT